MTDTKLLNRDPGRLLNLLADDVQELIALIAEQDLLPAASEEFAHAKLLSGQLNMARKIQDKTIFSVTGLQGAGKTTLVQRLYRLPDGILPISAGRSEALPILITESTGITSGEYVYKLRRSMVDKTNEQCKFIIKDENISHKKFLEIAKNPMSEDLWLEIEVPITHFGAGISLALLPGFERNERNRSQRDLEFMLSLSTSVIFVLNYRMLAQENLQLKMQMMIDRYKDQAPLFAVSFSDELSFDQREYYATLLSGKFDIPEDEAGRIIFTGNSADLSNWEDTIVASINHYGKSNHFSYKKQMEILRGLSSDAILLANSVNEQIRYRTLDQEENQTNLSEVLNTFKNEKKELRKSLEASLQESLGQHANNCSKEMDNYLKQHNKGPLKAFSQFFKGDEITLTDRITFKEKTSDLWNKGNEQVSEKLIMEVLNTTFEMKAQELGFAQEVEQPTVAEEAPNNPFAITTSGNATQAPKLKADGPVALERLTNYLEPKKTDTPVKLQKEDLEILPFLALGFTQSLLAASPVLQKVEGIELESSEQKVQTLANKINSLNINTSHLVKGTALFMGIDAMDGTFDTFGALTGILTKVGVSSAAAGPVAGLLIGGIVGGLAVNSGMQKVEQQRLHQSTYANRAFQTIAVQQKEAILATLDKVMSKMEERLIAVERYQSRSNSHFGKLDTTKYKAAHIKEVAGIIQGMTYRNELYLG
jgi:hypothetical protein